MLPEGDESPEKITYQAASPDEAALVTAAKKFGFFLYRYDLLDVSLIIPIIGSDCFETLLEWVVLDCLIVMCTAFKVQVSTVT